MENFPKDIYTEPTPDVDTLANLGPLTGMAGIWTGKRGLDINPKADGPEKQAFIEHMELQPIDAQTNGPQLFYGLRYHTRIVKPDDVETFHDQVGYWLWEPATGNIIQTLTIPRGQTAMATGKTTADGEKALYEEIEKLKTEPVSAEELQKAKNQIEAQFYMGNQSNDAKANQLGLQRATATANVSNQRRSWLAAKFFAASIIIMVTRCWRPARSRRRYWGIHFR